MLLTSRTCILFRPFSLCRPFSSSSFTATRYPLYYDLIRHRPLNNKPNSQPNSNPKPIDPESDMDRSKRKYYRKRAQRMLPDPDDHLPTGGPHEDFVELKPEIVDFPRLHAREQELYFHDAFAFPWEKDKHYRMVYQLEKKYFPEQSLDKAFVDANVAEARQPEKSEKRDGRGLVFFEDGVEEEEEEKKGVEERNVNEFFKCLKKVPKGNGGGGGSGKGGGRVGSVKAVGGGGEPVLVSRRTELPPRWDGPTGTVVLVDKPKGQRWHCYF